MSQIKIIIFKLIFFKKLGIDIWHDTFLEMKKVNRKKHKQTKNQKQQRENDGTVLHGVLPRMYTMENTPQSFKAVYNQEQIAAKQNRHCFTPQWSDCTKQMQQTYMIIWGLKWHERSASIS